MSLVGRVAIVTGAASGIGFATAKRFHEAGAAVVLADLDEQGAGKAAAELDPSNATVLGAACDVSDAAACRRLVERAAEQFGRVDVLHANAGIPFAGPIESVDGETLDRVIGVNLKGAFLTAQAVVPGMKRQRSGSIIFTSSLQGVIARPNYTPYTASKHGVVGLMKGLALELAPWNVRVNAIAPGPTDTPMLRTFSAGMAGDPDTGVERFLQGIPLGRLVSAEDIAGAALFLAGDDAAMVTGHVLVVDGGVTAG